MANMVSGSEVLIGTHGYIRGARGQGNGHPSRCSVIKVQGGACGYDGLLATFPTDFQLDEEGQH